MYQSNIIRAYNQFKHYTQRFITVRLYTAKIKILLKYINMNITTCIYVLICIYNMLQKYNIDTINMLLTVGLRQAERLRGLREVERFHYRVKIGRTTSRAQHNRTISL